MNKYLVFVLAVLLVFGLGSVAWTQEPVTDTTEVTVTAEEIDLLDVPAETALTLTATAAGATAYTQGTATDGDGLKYSHNSATNKKITASAAADTGNTTNDITLKVAIGTETAGTIVSEGTDQTDVLLWTDIAAGGYTQDLIWTADATFAGTLADDYVWTVTFTTADA